MKAVTDIFQVLSAQIHISLLKSTTSLDMTHEWPTSGQ